MDNTFMRALLTIIWLLLCCIPFYGISQSDHVDLKFEKITIDDGLSYNSVTKIMQDDKGFMWIGTFNGLNKYDANSFKIFRNIPGNEHSLSSNFVHDIVQDNEGNIWIATFNGLNKFLVKKGYFVRYYHDVNDSTSIGSNTIFSLFADSRNDLWIGTKNGLSKYDYANDIFERFNNKSGASNRISSINEDSEGNLWIATDGEGLERFDRRSGDFVHYAIEGENFKEGIGEKNKTIYIDSENNFWIGTRGNGFFIFNPATGATEHYSAEDITTGLNNNIVTDFIQLSPEQMWIATDGGGLNIFNKHNKSISTHKHDPLRPFGINSRAILNFFVDDQKNIWLGTVNGGINLYNPNRKKFITYYHNPLDENSISSDNARCIYQDKSGRLWVGTTGGGLNLFDSEKETFKAYKAKPGKNNSIGGDAIVTLESDSTGNLWIGTFAHGLTRFHYEKNEFEVFKSVPDDSLSLATNNIWDLLIDKDNNFWVGAQGGLHLFDTGNETFERILHDPKDKNSLSSNLIMCIDEDSWGNIWIGTQDAGVNLLDKEKMKFQRFLYSSEDSNSINNNYIHAIYEDVNKNLWICTNGGLAKYNREQNNFIRFTEEDGLPNNVVLEILDDKAGNLWLSSSEGIFQYNPETGKSRRYSKDDALLAEQFFPKSALKSADGAFYFGSVRGLVKFYPDSITKNPYPPKVVFSDMQIYNESVKAREEINGNIVLQEEIAYANEVNLTYREKEFTIAFAGLHFTNSTKSTFRYKLDGFDNRWRTLSSAERAITYTNLPYKSFYLFVQASNGEGIWSEPEALKISISPPYWKTWWFRLLVLLLISGLVLVLYFWRVNQLKTAQKRLAYKVDERTQELKEANKQLEDKNEEITNQNERIHDQNKDLIASEEELRTLNEELYSKNELLLKQKSELEAILIKLRETQTQLIHSEKMASIGVLTAGIAHEINNPLNFIQGGLYAIETYFSEKSESQLSDIKPLLQRIETGIERATGIIRSMNFFSHSNTGIDHECDLHQIIDNCLTLLQNETKSRIKITKNYTTEPFTLPGNLGKLNQVFLNLLTNACQAIEKKGTITITTLLSDNHVHVKIEDTGIGISEENLKKIMDPFFTTKAPGKGTGLGLSIVYMLVQEHLGELTCESVVGKGTTLTVSLPVKA